MPSNHVDWNFVDFGMPKIIHCPKCKKRIGSISEKGNLTMSDHNVGIHDRAAFCRCGTNVDETYEKALKVSEI